MPSTDQIITGAHRRRLVVTPTPTGVTVALWFRDPPAGKLVDQVELDAAGLDLLLMVLTEVKANA